MQVELSTDPVEFKVYVGETFVRYVILQEWQLDDSDVYWRVKEQIAGQMFVPIDDITLIRTHNNAQY